MLKYEQVAALLGMSVSGVRKLVARRKLAVVRMGHCTVRITQDAVNRYLRHSERKEFAHEI